MKINLLAVMCHRTMDDDMTDLFDEKIGNMKGAFSLSLTNDIFLFFDAQQTRKVIGLMDKIYHRSFRRFLFVFQSCKRSLLSFSRSSNLQND